MGRKGRSASAVSLGLPRSSVKSTKTAVTATVADHPAGTVHTALTVSWTVQQFIRDWQSEIIMQVEVDRFALVRSF